MIKFDFSLQNPFLHKEWYSIASTSYTITTYKVFELEVHRHASRWFSISIDLRWFGFDHAGPELGLNILGYEVFLGIRDTRHWNHKEHRWYIYDEKGQH